GTEVQLALGAREALAQEGIDVRVVSMPSTSVFDRQDAEYRASVLLRRVPRVAVEAGVTDGWRKYVGAVDDPHAAVVGLDRYGESAPAGDLFKFFGFTAERVTAAVRAVVANGATSNVKEQSNNNHSRDQRLSPHSPQCSPSPSHKHQQ